MIKNNFKKFVFLFLKAFLSFVSLLLLIFFLLNYYIINSSKNYIFDIDKLDNKRKIWLVLWAWIKYNKEPTDILKDRLYTSFLAYKLKKIKKIIVSWDNSKVYHNEPEVMKKYLMKLWVKKEDIYLDYAWFDTYDSIYRAKEIFWVKKLVIFTQKYHLYRALYLARKLWIDWIWVISDRHSYLKIDYFRIREIFSRIKAFFEVEIFRPKPKFLGKKIIIK